MQTIALSDFQNRCVVLLKLVEKGGESLLITENEHPLAHIVPCATDFTEKRTKELLAMLQDNVQSYDMPEEPIVSDSWAALCP